jgi:hypothetical protein
MNTYNNVFKSGFLAEIDGTTSATTKRADDENTGQVAALGFAFCSSLLDVVNQETLVLIRLDAWQKRVLAVSKLVGPGHDGESSASETSMLESVSDLNNVITTALNVRSRKRRLVSRSLYSYQLDVASESSCSVPTILEEFEIQ